MVINCEHRFSLDERAFWIPNNIKCDITEKKNMWILWSMMMVALIRQLSSLDTDSGNLARGRPTFASSTKSGETTSSRAVDGVFYESGHAFENCYASEYEETPWWMLQLNRPYGITYIYIMACGRLEHISVYIGNTTESLIFCDYNDGLLDPFKSLVLGCETQILGELIKIIAGKDGGEGKPVVLALSEISVQTVDHPDGRFLAIRKPQTFASTVHAGMDPRFAIDGITLSGSRIPICFISLNDYLPWWAVELDKYYDIDSILFQTYEPLGKISVYVGNTKETDVLCTYFVGPTVSDELVKLLCDRPILGRYVKIASNFYTENRTQNIRMFKLCEVEVYARTINVPTFNKSCGGVLTENTGWLASPDSDNDGLYDNDEDCWWFIIAEVYQAITINITDIDIEDNVVCGYDYLKVYDGFIDSKGELGTFCGSIVPPVLTSIYNVVYVQFKTDDSWTYLGFNATYSTNYVFQCGEVFHNSTGTFDYKFVETSDSPLTVNCTWVILAESMEFIDLRFLYINIGNSNSCELGSVKVYDGIIADYALVGSFCGDQSQVSIQSSSSVLFVRLTIHASFEDVEFIATYNRHCGALYRDERGLDFELINHDDDDVYDNNLNCTWKIVVNTHEKIVFDIMSIDIEDSPQCQNDYLKVYNFALDESGLVGTYCGSNPPSTIFTGSNVAYLRFSSNDNVTGTGFKARYQTQCELILKDTSGSFSSMDSDQDGYSDSYQSCIWIISGGDNKVVWLEISELDINAVNSGGLCSRSDLDDVFQIFEGLMDKRLLHDERCWVDNLSVNFTLTSTFSDVYVQYISKSSVPRTGFKANYILEDGDYTRLLQGTTGWIGAFDDDNNGLYDPNLRCTWVILHRRSTVLLLNIHEMDIEHHASCDFDFLKVSRRERNYFFRGQVESQIGTFCGSVAPPPIELGNLDTMMIIYFQSDGSISGKGFNATYHHIDREKQEEILFSSTRNETVGWIGFFRDIHIQSNDLYNCLWTIIAKESYSVLLRILTLKIDWTPNCEDNYLMAYDGSLLNDRQLGVLCGVRTKKLLSISNVMYVRLYMKTAGVNLGFLIIYSQVVQSYDSQTIYVDILSPMEALNPFDTDGDGEYDHKQDILWWLSAKENKIFTLYITYIDIQWGEHCQFDSLQVFNKTTRQGIFCGTNLHDTHKSQARWLHIHFHSDLTVAGEGFNARYVQEYDLIEKCSPDLLLTGPSAMFTSLNSDDDGLYDANLDCIWTIEAADTQIVKLHIHSMDIQGDDACTSDFLEISELILHGFSGRFCGSVPPPIITSVSNRMTVRFFSDENISGRGFNATYWQEDLICGGVLNQSSGEIRSMDRNKDGLYDNNLDCHWTIVCGPNQLVELRILSIELEMNIFCSFDYIEVFVNGTSLGKRCNPSSTESKFVSSSGFDIYFRSDAFLNAAGFVAVYLISDIRNNCGRLLNATATLAWFTSPDSDGDGLYDNNVNCSWTIVAPEDMIIEVQIDVKDIECEFDHLEVFSSAFCGQNEQSFIVSSTNLIVVNFFADASISGRGFDINYRAVTHECNESCDIKADWFSGRITSLDCDQDGFYDYNLRCTWTITGKFYLEIKIQIDELDIQETENCISDYVQVFDGLVEDETVLGKYCGTYTPRITHTSSENQLTVIFVSDFTIVGTGFNATYEIEFNYGCGAILSEVTDTFRAPDLDNSGQYDPRLRCYWIIPSTPDKTTYLTFRWMDIEWHELCTFDYVELIFSKHLTPLQKYLEDLLIIDNPYFEQTVMQIYKEHLVYEKTNNNTLLLGTYCGTTAPPVFVTQNIFIILFVSDISNSGRGFRAGFYKLEGTATPTQSQSIMTTTATQFITATTARDTTSLYQTTSFSRVSTDKHINKESRMPEPGYISDITTGYMRKSSDHTIASTTVDTLHETDRQEQPNDALTTSDIMSYTDTTGKNVSNSTENKITEISTTMTIPSKTRKSSQASSTSSLQVSLKDTNISTPEASVKVSVKGIRSSLHNNPSTTQTFISSNSIQYYISVFCITIVVIVAYLAN